MAHPLLDGILPQPAEEYSKRVFAQLIEKLQKALGTKMHTGLDAEETEAINFFLNGK